MRVTCVAVSSLALPMKSDESLRRPRRCGGFRTSFVGRCPDFVERDRLRRRQRHPVLRMAINPLYRRALRQRLTLQECSQRQFN